MGQIVKRKKKGRPSKADLALRSSGQNPASTEPERRRSLRRRNVRYNNFIDYDDYLEEFEEREEEEEEEEEEERRKEKKLKLVLKLNNENQTRNKEARNGHARENAESSEEEEGEEEDESEKKPLKKRKISGYDDSEAEEKSENEDDNDPEERERKVDGKGQDSVPGTPSDHPSGLPLPDKKTLELILDKLQKKDTYGVYAEPVDFEELPDYLDVIDHPMDFATVRKKLGNGSYSTFEQFQSDVFLICSNAMQYNAPETIYHKQASAIQELARKKFHKVKLAVERSEKEINSEQKTKSNVLAKKQMKKPLIRTMQEPVGSDFSSGATLATGDIQNGLVATQASGYERPSNNDGLVEGNSSVLDNNPEKAEELSSGKGLLSKFGRKQSVVDENRRATYNVSNQPVDRSESVFSTFEDEIKQLVAVGLHAENSYARSLARFAATLGPVAWKVASQRIEQALPVGCKFGRGWVGEYEPLPTSVLMLETRIQRESILFPKLQGTGDTKKDDVTSRIQVPAKVHPVRVPTSEGKLALFRPTGLRVLEGKQSLFHPTGTKASNPVNLTYQPHCLPVGNFAETQSKTSKQVELNLPPSSCQHDADIVSKKQFPKNSEMASYKPREMSRTTGFPESVPSKPLDNKGVVSGGLPNGKVTNSSLNNRMVSSPSDTVPNQMARATACFPKGQEQVLADTVEAMRISAEKAQKQQKPLNQSSDDTPVIKASVPSVRNDPNNAAAAAARAWMSIGTGPAVGFKPPTESPTIPKDKISADSLYNPTWQCHPQFARVQGQFPLPAGVQFQTEKNNFPFQAFMRHPGYPEKAGQTQNRPMVFPQLVATDLSRFQMQSPWQGQSQHNQPKQKQETLPPDLNIGFQSPGSPVKQSSGVVVDSQQPDLALQL